MAPTQTPPSTESEANRRSDPNYAINQLAKLDKLDKFETKIDGFESLLLESVHKQNSKIASLEHRNSQLESSNFKLERAIDELWKEVHGKNLILRGFEDSATENHTSLFQNTCDLLQDMTKCSIEPDVVYRMGVYAPGANRPIRIVLCKYRERNLIFECRDNIHANYSITADLPTDMRVDFAILFKKKEELAENGESSKINFKTREITTESGKGFASVHGILQPLEAVRLSKPFLNGRNAGRSGNPEFSKNGRGYKRSFPQPESNGNQTTENRYKYRRTSNPDTSPLPPPPPNI